MFTFEKIQKADNVMTDEELLREFATLTAEEKQLVLDYANALVSGNGTQKFGCGKLLIISAPVAAILLAQGFDAEFVINPHKPTRPAWLFDDLRGAAYAAVRAYDVLDKETPTFLCHIISRLEEEQNNEKGGAAD